MSSTLSVGHFPQTRDVMFVKVGGEDEFRESSFKFEPSIHIHELVMHVISLLINTHDFLWTGY